MKTARDFDEQVRRKRPHIRRSWCSDVVADPPHHEVQPDGRARDWGKVRGDGDAEQAKRSSASSGVMTLADGATVHNAFFDRRYRRNQA